MAWCLVKHRITLPLWLTYLDLIYKVLPYENELNLYRIHLFCMISLEHWCLFQVEVFCVVPPFAASIFWNVGIHPQHYTASEPRGSKLWTLPPWKSQNSYWFLLLWILRLRVGFLLKKYYIFSGMSFLNNQNVNFTLKVKDKVVFVRF
jgi:hypothetical protein